MNNYETQYLQILDNILKTGKKSSNRTGINTYKIWGAQMHIDLSEGFPLLTTKKMYLKSLIHELLWMIKGDTNIQYLLKNGVTFWTEWPFYRYQEIKPRLGGILLSDPILLTNQEKDFQNGKSFGHEIDNSIKKSISEKIKLFEQTIINNDKFAKQWGSIGEYGYGAMWRKFPYHQINTTMWTDPDGNPNGYVDTETGRIDQLTNVINDLKTNPDSRRIIITAWHPYHSNRKEDALLPACHNYIQFGTEELTLEERRLLLHKRLDIDERPRTADTPLYRICDEWNIPKYRLNCYYSMRSNDFFLGNPYNNAFYALFTHLVANHVNMVPGTLVYSGADVHLYENHIEQSKLQLTREPKQLPKLNIKTPGKSIFDIQYDDIEIVGYESHPAIKADVAV